MSGYLSRYPTPCMHVCMFSPLSARLYTRPFYGRCEGGESWAGNLRLYLYGVKEVVTLAKEINLQIL
jgi:hypothetical protein